MRRIVAVSRTIAVAMFALAVFTAVAGCEPDFRTLRLHGQRAMAEDNLAIAIDNFDRAYRLRPADADNLYDMGQVHLRRARQKAGAGNEPAALRDCDRAVWFFAAAIQSHPGMDAAVAAKNEALERKGQYEAALGEAEWASTFVGPDSDHQIFLARELEERGDYDAALLRYRQAVAMNRNSAKAHAALGEFLDRRGNTTMAVVHLKRSYELNPLQPLIADRLAELGEALPRTTPELEP